MRRIVIGLAATSATCFLGAIASFAIADSTLTTAYAALQSGTDEAGFAAEQRAYLWDLACGPLFAAAVVATAAILAVLAARWEAPRTSEAADA